MRQKFTDVPKKRKTSVRDFGKALSPAEVNNINKRFYDSHPGAAPSSAAKQSPQTPDEINQANSAYWEEIQKRRSITL